LSNYNRPHCPCRLCFVVLSSCRPSSSLSSSSSLSVCCRRLKHYRNRRQPVQGSFWVHVHFDRCGVVTGRQNSEILPSYCRCRRRFLAYCFTFMFLSIRQIMVPLSATL
jgi:hypothetical protein